jgi:GNAT superfamily N-acetyltransferase
MPSVAQLPMKTEFTISDRQGRPAGNATACLCPSLDELMEEFVIHRFEGGLAHYEPQFPYADYWPIFVFDNIWIEPEFRRKGLGSLAFNHIADHYQELGAQLGLLRIGTQGDSFEEGSAWRTRIYTEAGWFLLRHHHSEKAVIPLMCLPMKHRQLTCRPPSRSIHAVQPTQTHSFSESPHESSS